MHARAARTAGPRIVAVAASLALVVAACGGDDPEPPAGTAAPATTTPTAQATAAPTPEALIVSPGDLTSYRYAITLHVAGSALEDASEAGGGTATPSPLAGASFTISIDGEVVNPDREHSQTKASLGFIELSLERIQIEDRAWTREAGGEWKPATPGPASPAIGGDLEISPARIFAEGGSVFNALNAELGTLQFAADEVNGLRARRYDLDAEQFRAVFGGETGLLPGDSQPLDTRGTLWVAEESRVPVRIQLTSTSPDGEPAFEMDLTLTDLNGNITIEPPL